MGVYGIYNVGGKAGFTGHTENNLWNKEYTYNYGKYSSSLLPSYYNESHLGFWPETGAATLYLNFKWTHDDQTKFTAFDSRGTGYYDILLEFRNNQNSVLITVKSQSGIDLTPWGGTPDGTLRAEYSLNK